MSENCDVIVLFPFYGQFAAIRKKDSRHMVYKTYIFIMLQNLKTELKGFYHSSHTIILSKASIFAKKADFLKKMLTSAKLEKS